MHNLLNCKYCYWIVMIYFLGSMNAFAIEPNAAHIETQRSQISFGEDCRISMLLPNNMKKNEFDSLIWFPMPSWWKSKHGDYFQFNILCSQSNAENLPSTMAKFDMLKNSWVKDKKFMRESILKVLHDPRNTSAAYQPENENKYINEIYKATDIYDIKTINMHGWAEVAWSIPSGYVNENRELSFCLFHPPKALCGHGTVAHRSDSSKGDLTKYALEILKSIEFLP